MLRLCWRNLGPHKLRVALTVVAIAFGVSLMSGTYVLTDTINASFSSLVGRAFTGDSVVLVPRAPLGANTSAQISPITAHLVRRVSHVPGVVEASGQILTNVSLMDSHGSALGAPGAPSFVTGVVPAPFNELQIATGRPPVEGQVALDQATVSRNGLIMGSTIEVAGAGPVLRLRLVGTVRFAGNASFAGAGVALATMAQAQQAAGERGRYDEIDVSAVPGVTPEQLRQRLAIVLPSDVEARTGAQQVANLSANFAAGTSSIKTFLLIFAYVAVFVGAFIILNTFSVTVAQRTRELGLLRAVGASKAQTRRAVVAESAAFGLAGGSLGLGLGLALAPGLEALFKALGSDLPDTTTVVAPRTVIVSLVTGVGVSVLAGLAPALKAGRVPPVAAMREGLEPRPGWLGRHTLATGLAVTALGSAMVGTGLAVTGSGVLAGTGALVVFVGVGLLSPKMVPRLAGTLGTLVAWRGVAGRLARENARRQPGRTAVTSAALMVGLALVTFVSVLAAGARSTIYHDVSDAFAGNLVVETSSSNGPGIPGSLAGALYRVPGVELVAPVAYAQAKVVGVAGVDTVSGITPPTLFAMYHVGFLEGTPRAASRLGAAQVLVQSSFARKGHFHLGSRLHLVTDTGAHLSLVIAGVVDDRSNILAPLTVPRAVLERRFGQSDDWSDYVGLAKGTDSGQARRAVDRLLASSYPQAQALTAQQFERQQVGSVASVLDLVYVLLALTVVVSLLGLVNTLVLAIFERRREFGLLRAVGTTRSQVRQIVRYEAVITALIGAVIGLSVGVVAALGTAHWLVGPGSQVALPVGTLLVVLVLAGAAGVLAAVAPARRAARLDVLAAIAGE